jgi:hypothetical protein
VTAGQKEAGVVLAGLRLDVQRAARAVPRPARAESDISTARFERNYISGRARRKKKPGARIGGRAELIYIEQSPDSTAPSAASRRAAGRAERGLVPCVAPNTHGNAGGFRRIAIRSHILSHIRV